MDTNTGSTNSGSTNYEVNQEANAVKGSAYVPPQETPEEKEVRIAKATENREAAEAKKLLKEAQAELAKFKAAEQASKEAKKAEALQKETDTVKIKADALKEITEAKQALADEIARNHNDIIVTTLQSAFIKAGVIPSAVADAVEVAKTRFAVDEKRQVYVKSIDGSREIDTSVNGGTYLTVESAVKQFIEQRPYFLPTRVNSGSGSNGGNLSKDFNSMTKQQQMAAMGKMNPMSPEYEKARKTVGFN